MPARPHLTRARILAGALALVMLPLAQPLAAQQWIARLSGAAEEPPVSSPGMGLFRFTLTGTTLNIQGNFEGLTTPTVSAHIHCCTATPLTGLAGVALSVPSLAGFPLGVTEGSYDRDFDLTLASVYNPAFITANASDVTLAREALLAGMNSGRAYFNVHTSRFPGGEIRGFLVQVPEPSSVALLLSGAGVLALIAVRRRPVQRARATYA